MKKKASLIILFSMVVSVSAYAGTQMGFTQAAFALPQPCTIFICAAGMGLMRCLTKRIP